MNKKMGTIFINLEKSKVPDPNRLVLNLEYKTNVKRSDCMIKSWYLLYMENIKKNKNDKIELSGPTWDEEFEILNGSYFLSNFRNYFEYIVKKHEFF